MAVGFEWESKVVFCHLFFFFFLKEVFCHLFVCVCARRAPFSANDNS
jgi:hypothetical protein